MRATILLACLSNALLAQNAAPWVRSNNLLLNPGDLTQAVGWQTGATATTTYGQTDPNSGSTATLLSLSATNSTTNYVRQPVFAPPSTTYTLEVTAKQTVGSITNLVSSPTDLTVAPWQHGSSTVITAGQPDQGGGNTATLLTNGASGDQFLRQPFTSSLSTPYIVSIIVKKSAVTDWFMIGLSDYTANAATAWFNLATGALGTRSSVGSGKTVFSTITSLGSGWYLCSVDLSQVTVAGYIDIRATNADNTTNATNGGAVVLWQPVLNKASWLMLSIGDYSTASFIGWFDLVNGVVGQTSASGGFTVTSSSIASAGSGWYTCTLVGVVGSAGGGAANLPYYYDLRTVIGDTSLIGVNGYSMLMWHPQIFQGSTSYAYGAALATPKYSYFGFAGDPINWFRASGSDDGATWTGYDGLWTTPTQINAPQVLYYTGQYFFHAAQANDQSPATFHNYLWYVGKADANANVAVVATIDWSAQISSLYACFSGSWFVANDGTLPHLLVPCSASDSTHMIVYETHATSADLTTWSNPSAITISGGASSYYDPKPFLIGSTYYLWLTQNAALQVDLATASAFAGPYTVVGSNVFPGTTEGTAMFRTETGWRIGLESLPSHQMKYSDCNSIFPDVCTWTARTNWTEGVMYRHGSIIRTPISPAGMLAVGQ